MPEALPPPDDGAKQRRHGPEHDADAGALPDRSLSRAFVLFPDPWPKTRHHKRRFVQRDTLDVLARLLKPGSGLGLAAGSSGALAPHVEEGI